MRNPTKYLRRWVSRRSGRYALQVAGTVGCRVVGVDISEPGIQTANQLATTLNVSAQSRFESCDVFSGQAQLMRKRARSLGPKLLRVHFGNTVDRPLLRIARFSAKWRAATFNYCNGLAKSPLHSLCSEQRIMFGRIALFWCKTPLFGGSCATIVQ
jgi:hypothetical protein